MVGSSWRSRSGSARTISPKGTASIFGGISAAACELITARRSSLPRRRRWARVGCRPVRCAPAWPPRCRTSSALLHLDAVRAQYCHDSLLVVRRDDRCHSLPDVDDECHPFVTASQVQVEPATRICSAPEPPPPQRAEPDLLDCANLCIRDSLRPQEESVLADRETVLCAGNQAIVVHHRRRSGGPNYGRGRSRCREANCRSAGVMSDIRTGVMSVQCASTGQRCSLHGPSRRAFSDPPGIQSVVNTWPLRQRTTVLAPIQDPRRRATTAASATVRPAATASAARPGRFTLMRPRCARYRLGVAGERGGRGAGTA